MSQTRVALLDLRGVDVFRRIRLEALREEPAAFASSAEDWERLSEAEWRRRLADTPVFVAFVDDAPVGVMGLMRERAAKTAHRATLVMVYVRKDLRRLGLARQLLDTLTSHAIACGIRQLELAVSADNAAARGFYRREGFVEIGIVPGGHWIGGREIDEILMARRISSPLPLRPRLG